MRVTASSVARRRPSSGAFYTSTWLFVYVDILVREINLVVVCSLGEFRQMFEVLGWEIGTAIFLSDQDWERRYF